MIALFSCTRDSFEPIEEEQTLYYLLVKVEIGADLNPLKEAAAACFKKHGRYRVTNVYLGTKQKQALLVTRKFSNEREAKRVMKALRKEPMFRKLEMKIVSQVNYRKMLKQRTFYAVY